MYSPTQKNLNPRVSTITVNKMIVMAVELKKNSNCLCTITKHFTEQLAMNVSLKMVQIRQQLVRKYRTPAVSMKYSLFIIYILRNTHQKAMS